MANEWQETTLGELGTLRNGANFSGKDYGEDHPVISVKSLFRGRFAITTNLDAIKAGVIKKIDGYLIRKDDILFARSSLKRSGSGQSAIVRNPPKGTIFSGFTIRFRVNDYDQAVPLFLFYNFQSPQSRENFARIATGTTISNLSQANLNSVIIKLPPLQEQKAIAHILDSLDDKIELNRQMNETLEAMAHALFKSWFVDFDPVIDNALTAGNTIPDVFADRATQRKAMNKDEAINPLFPDAFEYTEEMGWIPEGWKVRQLKTFGKVVTGKTPPKKIEVAYTENGTPFITPTDIDDAPFVFSTSRFLSETGIDSVKNSVLKKGSICVTCIGSQMGKTTISPSESVSNQQINSITECEQTWRNFLFFDLRRRKEEIFLLGSSGSTMPILNKSNFEMLPILDPTAELLISLDMNFQSTLDSILKNTAQSDSLSKLRDTLLPKLLSGELRIHDAEKLVEEEAQA